MFLFLLFSFCSCYFYCLFSILSKHDFCARLGAVLTVSSVNSALWRLWAVVCMQECHTGQIASIKVVLDSLCSFCERYKLSPANMSKKMTTDSVELRLINEFDGLGEQSITEWLEKVELVCSLRGVTELETIIPLRLSGGAFKVYQQIPSGDRGDATKIMDALKAAFGDDPFAAYDLFISRKLRPAESVDVYLADLRRLATAFGGVSDKALGCAFVSGLPEVVRQSLRASSRMEKMDVSEILQRARAILTDESIVVGAVRARGGATSLPQRTSEAAGAASCFECGLESSSPKLSA